MIRRLFWPVLVVVAVLWVLRFYGWHRYSELLSELMDRSRATEPEPWVCEEPWPDLCKILSINVKARQGLLSRPEPYFQMRALAITRQSLDMVLEPRVSPINLHELLSYLETDGDASWRQLVADSASEECSFAPYALSTDLLVGGFRGALCLGTLKGLDKAVEQPNLPLTETVVQSCSDAFIGASGFCGGASKRYSNLVIAAVARRNHLKLVEETQEMLRCRP